MQYYQAFSRWSCPTLLDYTFESCVRRYLAGSVVFGGYSLNETKGDNFNRINIVLWFLQRVSGQFLILVVPLHMWIQHYAERSMGKAKRVIDHRREKGTI